MKQLRAARRLIGKPSRRDLAPPSGGVARPPRIRSAIPPGQLPPRAPNTRFLLPKTFNQLPTTNPARGGGFWGDPKWRVLTRPLRFSANSAPLHETNLMTWISDSAAGRRPALQFPSRLETATIPNPNPFYRGLHGFRGCQPTCAGLFLQELAEGAEKGFSLSTSSPRPVSSIDDIEHRESA